MLLIALTVVCGCTEKRTSDAIPPAEAIALEQGEKFVLFSLEPQEALSDEKGRFHRWKVLGETSIDNADRQRVVAALKKGVAESDGVRAECFMPRHGIRVIHDGKEFDFVICFECLWSERYIDGQANGALTLSRTPQPTFDEVLSRASVPLAKPRTPSHER